MLVLATEKSKRTTKKTQKTTFTTHHRFFHYTSVLRGPKSAPETFQMAMKLILVLKKMRFYSLCTSSTKLFFEVITATVVTYSKVSETTRARRHGTEAERVLFHLQGHRLS